MTAQPGYAIVLLTRLLNNVSDTRYDGRLMKLSMRGDYGVRAVVDLAQRYGRGPIQSAEIAGRQAIPEPYLDQLLSALRKGGIIKSTRGPQGGHALARPPAEITLAEVIDVLEGPINLLACLDEPGDCSLSPVCSQRDVWIDVTRMIRDKLANTTIEGLAQRQAEREARPMYHI